jgi:recombinational DNA repair protein (RecF pathway)
MILLQRQQPLEDQQEGIKRFTLAFLFKFLSLKNSKSLKRTGKDNIPLYFFMPSC